MAHDKSHIYVTRTTFPALSKYSRFLKRIWKNKQITNHGPLSYELEKKLKKYLGVNTLHFVANGTIAIEVAIKVLKLQGDIITTPFSYVATTSAILWTSCKPVFVDIDEKTLCLDPSLIERAITPKTSAILATHVFGNACEIEKIERIAKRHKLKVVYDAAHAFGVKYKKESILLAGDVSTISFHATKLFHTAEGGAVVTKFPELSENIFLAKAFGHRLDDHFTLGINGKNSELHAAVGLCILPMVDKLIMKRRKVNETYMTQLRGADISYPVWNRNATRNYGYFPVIFKDQKTMQKVKDTLERNGIFPRRYFYPSINKLPYVKSKSCPVSESIANRILCLPMYDTLTPGEIGIICKHLKNIVK